MTIFSLGSACDLEHFSSNTKLENESNENSNYQAPVVPMPTDPPTFGNTNYQWKSDGSAIQGMTNRNFGSNTFNPSVGKDSQDWGNVNFGPDYWGENTDSYSFNNKLLNNNLNANKFKSDGPEMVMPGMKPVGAFMPPARTHFVKTEDMNGRDVKMRRPPQQKQPIIVLPPEPELPDYPADKIEKDTKNLWFFLIILLIIVVGSIMYKTNYF